MRYLYGIQPTGRIHLGNYLGGLKLAIERDADILIAQLHAETTQKNPEEPDDNRLGFFDTLKKLGAKNIFPQEAFAPELMWKILCLTPVQELERMTQYKSKKKKTAGLLTYPALMAADIILSYATYVIVGEDQMQHMEFYRKACSRLGIKKIAKPLLTATPRIMSIVDPTKKMSKSLGDNHCLYLFDEEENARKIMRAPTTSAGIKNLKQIAIGLRIVYDEKNNKESKEKLIKALNKI